MTLQASTLRPGLLVSLSTTITGNVAYKRREIEADHITDDGTKRAAWETQRTIFDPAEDERARVVRSACRSVITAVCARSAFGLLCPEGDTDKLERAIAEARDAAEAFNKTATLSRVSVYVLTGRIAPDDVEAVKAINSEIRELMDAMRDGIGNLDVQAVREAANKARNLSGMLTEGARNRIADAIEVARTAARKIVKAGDQAAAEIDRAAMRKIDETRTAFLDLDETPAETAAPDLDTRGLDLAPELPNGERVIYVAPTSQASFEL